MTYGEWNGVDAPRDGNWEAFYARIDAHEDSKCKGCALCEADADWFYNE